MHVQRTVLADPGVHHLRGTGPEKLVRLVEGYRQARLAARHRPGATTGGLEPVAPEVPAYADAPAGPRQVRVPAGPDGDGYVPRSFRPNAATSATCSTPRPN